MTFRSLFPTFERYRYLLWKMRPTKPIVLRMKSGTILKLRPNTSDYHVAYELFIFDQYRANLDPETVYSIVDLGANVGFSTLQLAHGYPHAEILAFEPDATNAAAFRENIALNRLELDVRLIKAAAGTHDGIVRFSGAGTMGKVATDGHPVRMVDLFSCCRLPVDILKMDIEGGEYDILSDPRFETLLPRCIVMEWHNNGDWVKERLISLGYTITRSIDAKDTGILSATA